MIISMAGILAGSFVLVVLEDTLATALCGSALRVSSRDMSRDIDSSGSLYGDAVVAVSATGNEGVPVAVSATETRHFLPPGLRFFPAVTAFGSASRRAEFAISSARSSVLIARHS